MIAIDRFFAKIGNGECSIVKGQGGNGIGYWELGIGGPFPIPNT